MHSRIANKNILIIGNGSGGHFYPSKVVADQLCYYKANIFYVVSKDRIDEKEISKTDYRYISLPFLGLNKNYLKFTLNQIKNIKKIFQYIKENKIDLCIGFGGSLSFSLAIASKLAKVQIIIHEQNAILGRANKLLLNKVKLLSSFDINHRAVTKVGNPVVTKIKKQTTEYFDVIVVFGSQGSSSLNKIFLEYLKTENKLKILYVFGQDDQIIDKLPSNIKVVKYVDNLKEYFNNTKLVITRGGASTLAELSMTNAKVCVIPSPYVVNNHQYYNSIAFQKEFGCQILDEKEINITKIKEIIYSNLNDFKNINIRKKITTQDYLENFIKEIENELV